MKIIFIKDLKGQGKKDDIKEVRDGYANNFLIKKGYAIMYNSTNKTKLESDIKNRELENKEDYDKCLKLKTKLEKEELKFKVKTGDSDKVFGTVSSKQIHNELLKKEYDIDKRKIKTESLGNLGYHTVKIELRKDVIVNLKVKLEK